MKNVRQTPAGRTFVPKTTFYAVENEAKIGGKAVGYSNSITQQSKFWKKSVDFKGNKVHQRNDLIDPTKIDSRTGLSNLELMKSGRAPKGPDGKPINLHHTIRPNDLVAAKSAKFENL